MLIWLGDFFDNAWNWVIVVLFLALGLWETLRPARMTKLGTALRWFTNISMYAVNNSLVYWLVPAAVVNALVAHFWDFPRPFTTLTGASDGWIVLIAGVLLLDLYTYVIHRVQHQIFVFWRFHSVHHSDTEMDASTTLRHHPVEYVASSLLGGVLFAIIGVPEWVFPVHGLISLVVSLFQHVNAGSVGRLDRALQWALVTPGMHQIHHSADAEDYESNFGTIFSVWDRMFGTFRAEPVAGRAAMAFGVPPFTGPEYARPRWAWLLPFALRRRALVETAGAETTGSHAD